MSFASLIGATADEDDGVHQQHLAPYHHMVSVVEASDEYDGAYHDDADGVALLYPPDTAGGRVKHAKAKSSSSSSSTTSGAKSKHNETPRADVSVELEAANDLGNYGGDIGIALGGGGIRSAVVGIAALERLLELNVHPDYYSFVSGGGYAGAAFLSHLKGSTREHALEAARVVRARFTAVPDYLDLGTTGGKAGLLKIIGFTLLTHLLLLLALMTAFSTMTAHIAGESVLRNLNATCGANVPLNRLPCTGSPSISFLDPVTSYVTQYLLYSLPLLIIFMGMAALLTAVHYLFGVLLLLPIAALFLVCFFSAAATITNLLGMFILHESLFKALWTWLAGLVLVALVVGLISFWAFKRRNRVFITFLKPLLVLSSIGFFIVALMLVLSCLALWQISNNPDLCQPFGNLCGMLDYLAPIKIWCTDDQHCNEWNISSIVATVCCLVMWFITATALLFYPALANWLPDYYRLRLRNAYMGEDCTLSSRSSTRFSFSSACQVTASKCFQIHFTHDWNIDMSLANAISGAAVTATMPNIQSQLDFALLRAILGFVGLTIGRWVYMDGTSFANPDAKYDLTNLISLALLCLPQLVSFFDQAYLALGFYFFMVGFFCFTAFSELLQRALCYSSIFRTILLVTGMYPDHSEQANESGIVDEPEKLHGYFYLSDGGYFESLGILQLIREGRKNIFCFDCLEDPNRRMSCLATVLDTAVSSGLIKDYEIEENPLDIVPRPVGGVLISNQRHLTITCTTHEGDKYTIFYCKATLCDPEIPDNRHHALLLHSLQDPTFPHTPTVHQYLSRPQVQAYIKLGQISAETLAAKYQAKVQQEGVSA